MSIKSRKNGIRKGVLAVLICVCGALAAAGFAESVQAAPRLNKKELTLYVGEQYRLRVKGTKKKVTWSSSAKNTVSVKKGKVTARKAGKAVITAKAGKKSLKCRVTVKQSVYLVDGKAKNTVNVSMKKGETKSFTITYTLNGGVSYRSANAAVVHTFWGSGWQGKDVKISFKALNAGDDTVVVHNDANKAELKFFIHVE